MRRLLTFAACAGAILAGCGGEESGRDRGGTTRPGEGSARPSEPTRPPVPASRPRVKPFVPDSAEVYAKEKRLAGRLAQAALTYRRGASAREVAASLPDAAVPTQKLARILEPVVDPKMRSAGEVLYPQLSGVTEISLGAMVVVRQTLEDAAGSRKSVTRVLDVRLRRAGGRWSLDTIASVGGRAALRPSSLPREAERVLEHPKIDLPDSARWDIYRGNVDRSLLVALATVADQHELSIAVLGSGHPPNVWATDRPSAHSRGLAADIYAVDGRLVIRQRRPGSVAHAAAQAFLSGGARQIGSPWSFGGGARSFTDAVHQDHIHLQQSAGGVTAGA